MVRYFLLFCLIACLIFLACNADGLIEKEKHFGIHEECNNIISKEWRTIAETEFIKDSIKFKTCCERYNSCWVVVKNEYTKSTDTVRIIYSTKQQEPGKNILNSMICLKDSVKYRENCNKLSEGQKKYMFDFIDDPRKRTRADLICANDKSNGGYNSILCEIFNKK